MPAPRDNLLDVADLPLCITLVIDFLQKSLVFFDRKLGGISSKIKTEGLNQHRRLIELSSEAQKSVFMR